MKSSCLSFSRLALETNQISFILSEFNCNRRVERHAVPETYDAGLQSSPMLHNCHELLMSEQMGDVSVETAVDGERNRLSVSTMSSVSMINSF